MTPIESVAVLIVGSGPAGSSTALHLLQQDPAWAGKILIVDQAVHPREKLCGGGITHLGTNVLTRLGLPFAPPHVSVREVRVQYQDRSYSFFGDPVFRIVRRDQFDHWLVQQVRARGVTVREGEAVQDIRPTAEYVEVKTSRGLIRAQVVIAADGSRSFVRRRLKWKDAEIAAPHVARLLEVLTPEDAGTDPLFRDSVAVFDFTPMTGQGLQGYYWDFPSFVDGRPTMNRGVFDSRARPERPKADLKETLRAEMGKRDRDLEKYSLKGHPIRWWHPRNQVAQSRVLLVGDAAGADPLFGEGISFALGYGEVAAATVTDAFARNAFDFADYGRRLRRHPLFRHLTLRTRLARFAYLLNYPRLFRAGWWVARRVIKLTPWRNPEFTPGEPLPAPQFPAGSVTAD